MKQLFKLTDENTKHFVYHEGHENSEPVVAKTETSETTTDTTSVVEASAKQAAGKGVMVGPINFLKDPNLWDNANKIIEDVAQVKATIEGGDGTDVVMGQEDKNISANSELTPETAQALSDRGIDLETFEDRTIGGNSEAEMLSSYLEKNPDVDAKALSEATGNLFSQMTPEEQAKAMAEMTPEEYEAFLEAAQDLLENPVDISENTYTDPETGEKITETNQFNIGSILEAAGIGGNHATTSNSSGNVYPGTFDVPSVSNTELLAAVETLAGQIGADPAALKAVVAVESGGDMGATRFEPHHASKGQDEATSFGAFQIMGLNATTLGMGYTSATDMKNKFQSGGVSEQVAAFGGFLKTRDLVPHIAQGQQPDFRSFAHGYNGSGYAKLNYHGKMQAAYEQYRKVS